MPLLRAFLCFTFAAALPCAAAATSAHIWNSSHELRLTLEDPLDHPLYWWPRTLLTYPVRFDEPADLSRLRLTLEGSTEPVPIQWTNVVSGSTGVRSAILCFFSDLPSGAKRDFVLRSGNRSPAPVNAMRESRDGHAIVLDTGALRIKIPAGGTVPAGSPVPAPVLQLGRESRWFGVSRFAINGDTVERIDAERLESGPLLVTYRLTYVLRHSGRYIAVIRAAQGEEFVTVREDMESLEPSARGAWSIDWTNLPVAYRQSANHPFPFPSAIAPYDQYHWETVAQRQSNTHLGLMPEMKADGVMPFALGVYEPWWAFHASSFANFWDPKSPDAIGAFVDKVEDWQDHDYAIWHESSKLEVQFAYRDNTLSYLYPLARGSRSTCLTLYNHQRDIDTMHRLEDSVRRQRGRDGLIYGTHLSPTSYALFLQNRHGTLDLNVIKDWVLTESTPHPRPAPLFKTGMVQSASDLERRVFTSSPVCELPMTGTRQNGGFGPVASREIEDWWIDGFDRLAPSMSPAQRKRLTAMYLFMAYIHAAEDYMPMIPMLAGHPNFLSDVKSVPAAMTYLYPWHPEAGRWSDEYEKFLELNTRYHTRPDVAEWNSHGGRWTENLGTYVWAFLRPALRADFLLRTADGYERFTTPQIASLGDWLVNALSAPFNGESEEIVSKPGFDRDRHEWGVVRPGQGPRRIYPPMGAHAERRIPPRGLWYLGLTMARYAPLTAEHLMWAARPADQDMETLRTEPDTWAVMYGGPDNYGTNPHLRTSKYTGFGITLRAAVDTPEELSVHLQQIDDGPNYRWGNAGEGGNGVLYFYAAGQSYSYNGTEDVGDRVDQDTDFCTTFGVFKDGHFRSLGRNVLSRPLYDLGAAQFTELVPRTGQGNYAAPEYVSRSVLLAGHEYFALYDDVFNESLGHRLSWYVRHGETFPSIQLIRGAARGIQTQTTEIRTSATTGRWYDGLGDSLAIVSHRQDIRATPAPYGAKVTGPGFTDWVFREPAHSQYAAEGVTFDGTAGWIRKQASGYQLALFHGTRVSVPGLELATGHIDLGVSATVVSGQPITGQLSAPQGSQLRYKAEVPGTFYLDGQPLSATRKSDWFGIEIPAGEHHWELTPGRPTPLAPEIARTENFAHTARVIIRPVAGATKYRLALSRDNGKTWQPAGESAIPEFRLPSITDKSKVHVRATALNAEHESAAGPEYPIYLTDGPAPPPDGLHLRLSNNAVAVEWGEVLGVASYRLYRHARGEARTQLVYQGLDRHYTDHPSGVVEYQVSAVSGNGEGRASRPVTTEPTSWRNFDPRPGEPFRRTNVETGNPMRDYYPH